MRTMTLHYPGDPPLPIEEMTREEFLLAHPRTPWVITNLDTMAREEIPVGPDQIFCDLCNEDPGGKIYVLDGRRGYCEQCFKEGLEKFCR